MTNLILQLFSWLKFSLFSILPCDYMENTPLSRGCCCGATPFTAWVMVSLSSSWRAHSLLGTDDSGFLFTHVFLRHMSVRAGLTNSPLLAAKGYCSPAEEADGILLTTRSFSIQTIFPDSPAASPTPPPILPGASSMVARIGALWKRALFSSSVWLVSSLHTSTMVYHLILRKKLEY